LTLAVVAKDTITMATRQTRPLAAALPAPRKIPVADLYLDPDNPRLAGFELAIDRQDDIIRVLWEGSDSRQEPWSKGRFESDKTDNWATLGAEHPQQGHWYDCECG
jgi:hypothetical protein